MRLLLVYPFVPYPPDDGGKIGFFNPVKYLSRFHNVSVIAFAQGEAEDAVRGLKQFCNNVFVFRRPLGDPYRLIRGAFCDPPGSSAKYWHTGAGEFIRGIARSVRPDIVEFHHLNTAGYRPFVEPAPAVLREHNVEYKVWERYARSAPRYIDRAYAKWAAPRVRSYEARCVGGFQKCLVVSKADAAHLRAVSPYSAIEVVPSGVDTEYFTPADVPEEPFSITMVGSFSWLPKQQSLLAFFKQVAPKIKALMPEANLYIVGKGIPEYLKKIGSNIHGVNVVGEVPDVRPYIARSALLINYLESGGGIALKVLEAMAMRKPVLSNALGCEGVDVVHGQSIFVAQGADDFAMAAACLLRDAGMRKSLGAEGYRAVVETYGWDSIATKLGHIYQNIVDIRNSHLAEAVHI